MTEDNYEDLTECALSEELETQLVNTNRECVFMWTNKQGEAFGVVMAYLPKDVDKGLERIGVVTGASVYPFVWNILMAARNEGLGGVITTAIVPEEESVREILDLPKNHAIAAMIPIGKPVKQLSQLTRRNVEDFTTSSS